jgi:isoleucyl-tRNA synthetase
MKKIPDLTDVWFDSGAMPYAQWHWPMDNKDVFKKQFPADFIIEGIDQTRGWFYTLLAVSTLLGKGAPYKNVMVNGHTLDEKGKKMSKSLGNVIRPDELMDVVGVDAARWYFYAGNTIGEPMIVSINAAKDRLKGFVFTLYNCLRFFELYKDNAPAEYSVKGDLDKWLLSRLNNLIVKVTEKLDAYDSMSAAREIESFVNEDFSNWWLRRSRKRIDALPLLRLTLLEVVRLAAPFMPYVSEDIYQKLHHGQMSAVSVHLSSWPAVSKKLINKKLEEEMDEVREVIAKGLAVRKENQIKVRQPLRSVTVNRQNKFRKDFEELVRDELNVKGIIYDTSVKEVSLDKELDRKLTDEGYAREVMRQIQDLRKEAGYKVSDSVHAQWESKSSQLSGALLEWKERIKNDAALKDFSNGPGANHVFDIEKEIEIASGHSLWIGLKKT